LFRSLFIRLANCSSSESTPCASGNRLNNPKSKLGECFCGINSKKSFVGWLSIVFVLETGLSCVFSSGLLPLFHQSLNTFADRFLSNCEPFQTVRLPLSIQVIP